MGEVRRAFGRVIWGCILAVGGVIAAFKALVGEQWLGPETPLWLQGLLGVAFAIVGFVLLKRIPWQKPLGQPTAPDQPLHPTVSKGLGFLGRAVLKGVLAAAVIALLLLLISLAT